MFGHKVQALNLYAAIVKKIDDSKGRVMVDIIGVAEDVWAVPLFPCAGKNQGFYAHPEIGDNCFVGFLADTVGTPRIEHCVILGYWYPHNQKNVLFDEGNPPEKVGVGYKDQAKIEIGKGSSGIIKLFQGGTADHPIARGDVVRSEMSGRRIKFNIHVHTITVTAGYAEGHTHPITITTSIPDQQYEVESTEIDSENKTQ